MKNFLNNHILIHLNFKFSDQVKHTYLFTFLRAILMATGVLFVPYYLFVTLGFYYVIFYQLLVFSLFRIFALSVVKKIIKKYGIEISYFLSILFFVIVLFLLNLIDIKQHIFSIFFIAFFASLSTTFYWFPLHVSIALFASPKTRVEERYFVDLLLSIVKIIFPFFSAFLIFLIGFKSFFGLISFTIFLVSLYLFLKLKKMKRVTKIKVKLKSLPSLREFFVFFFEAFNNILAILFYLIVVSTLNKITQFGFFLTLSNILALIFSFYLSRRIDRFKDYTLAILGILLLVVLYLHVYFIRSSFIVKISFLLNSFLLGLITTPYLGWLYSFSRKQGVEHLYYREWIFCFSFLVGYGSIILFKFDLFKAFYFFSLFQIIFALLFYFIGKKIEIIDELSEDFLKHFKEIKIK